MKTDMNKADTIEELKRLRAELSTDIDTKRHTLNAIDTAIVAFSKGSGGDDKSPEADAPEEKAPAKKSAPAKKRAPNKDKSLAAIRELGGNIVKEFGEEEGNTVKAAMKEKAGGKKVSELDAAEVAEVLVLVQAAYDALKNPPESEEDESSDEEDEDGFDDI